LVVGITAWLRELDILPALAGADQGGRPSLLPDLRYRVTAETAVRSCRNRASSMPGGRQEAEKACSFLNPAREQPVGGNKSSRTPLQLLFPPTTAGVQCCPAAVTNPPSPESGFPSEWLASWHGQRAASHSYGGKNRSRLTTWDMEGSRAPAFRASWHMDCF